MAIPKIDDKLRFSLTELTIRLHNITGCDVRMVPAGNSCGRAVKMLSKKALVAVVFTCLWSTTTPAQSTTLVSYLTDTQISGAILPASGHYGVVTVIDYTGYVGVDVQLDSGIDFVHTGGPHTEFAVNLDKNISTSQVTNIVPSTFSVTDNSNGLSPSGATPYGTFSVGLNCVTCSNGGAGKVPPPLDFIISGISTTDFVANGGSSGGGYFFAADLIVKTTTGKTGTGTVAAPTISTSGTVNATVPEPASVALMIVGIAGLGAGRKFYRHS